MFKIFSFIIISVLTMGSAMVTVASSDASTVTDSGYAYGVDISWPQCGKSTPKGAYYVIVGLNDGNANSTNPCLSKQLESANLLTGGDQTAVQYYVNTGNPGFKGSGKKFAWPSTNTYKSTRVKVPAAFNAGVCKGKESYDNTACAYMYGWSRAYDDAHKKGLTEASAHIWWLDVETINSWNYANPAANQAVLTGMNDYFTQVLHAKTGLYTVTKMWDQIVGVLPATSALNTLPVWYPIGDASPNTAAAAYHVVLSPTAGAVVMVQYIVDGQDYNYSEVYTTQNQGSLVAKVLGLFFG